jgi:hypothetical protein
VSAPLIRSPAPRVNADDRANSKVQQHKNIASARRREAEAVKIWRAQHAGGARAQECRRRNGPTIEFAEINLAGAAAFLAVLPQICCLAAASPA